MMGRRGFTRVSRRTYERMRMMLEVSGRIVLYCLRACVCGLRVLACLRVSVCACVSVCMCMWFVWSVCTCEAWSTNVNRVSTRPSLVSHISQSTATRGWGDGRWGTLDCSGTGQLDWRGGTPV